MSGCQGLRLKGRSQGLKMGGSRFSYKGETGGILLRELLCILAVVVDL